MSQSIDILSRKRRMPLGHPWNRGYPNNKPLRQAAGETPATVQQMRIGRVTLRQMPDGKLWLQHEDGEGMQCKPDLLEKFFLEQF